MLVDLDEVGIPTVQFISAQKVPRIRETGLGDVDGKCEFTPVLPGSIESIWQNSRMGLPVRRSSTRGSKDRQATDQLHVTTGPVRPLYSDYEGVIGCDLSVSDRTQSTSEYHLSHASSQLKEL